MSAGTGPPTRLERLAAELRVIPRTALVTPPVAALAVVAVGVVGAVLHATGDASTLVAVGVARDRLVVFSTHVIEDVVQTCERLAVLRAGRALFQGDVSTLTAGGGGLEDEYLRLMREAGPAIRSP